MKMGRADLGPYNSPQTAPWQDPLMGRNTWAEKLQALFLSNCTLRYLVLMAIAHMICYQHFVSKTSMANVVRSKSGPGALWVGPRRSLCRGPTLSVGLRSLCRGPALSLRGPALCVAVCVKVRRSSLDALCVGPRARRCLCRAPALSASGPGSLLFVSGSGAARRSLSGLCRGPGPLSSGPAVSVSVSGPGALSVGAGCSVSGRSALCPARARLCRGAAVLPTLSVSGSGLCRGPANVLCVGPRRSLCLCVGPGALSVGFCVRAWRAASVLCRGPALSVSGRRDLCVRRSLCRARAVSVSGPGTLCVCVCGALSVGPGLSLCRGRRSLCRPRRSLCWGPVLSVSASGGLRRPRYSLAVCVGPSPQLRSACSSSCLCSLRAFNSDAFRAPPARVTYRLGFGPLPPCAIYPALRAHHPAWLALHAPPSAPRGAPSSDPRATHPVLWVLLAYQPDVFHHVILKQCFALVIANTCSHSLGLLTQILDNSIKEHLHQLLFVRVYLRLRPLYFFGQGFCAICLLGPQKQTALSQMIRGLDLLQPSDKPTLPCVQSPPITIMGLAVVPKCHIEQ